MVRPPDNESDLPPWDKKVIFKIVDSALKATRKYPFDHPNAKDIDVIIHYYLRLLTEKLHWLRRGKNFPGDKNTARRVVAEMVYQHRYDGNNGTYRVSYFKLLLNYLIEQQVMSPYQCDSFITEVWERIYHMVSEQVESMEELEQKKKEANKNETRKKKSRRIGSGSAPGGSLGRTTKRYEKKKDGNLYRDL